MDIRSLIATYLLPLLGTILLVIVRRWAASATRANDATGHSQRIATLERYADAAVAYVQASFVEALKDPTKPGTWSAVAGATARDLAIRGLRETAPTLIDEVQKDGGDLDKLFSSLIESAVLKLKRPAPAHGLPPVAAPTPVAAAAVAPTAIADATARVASADATPADVATDSSGTC